MGKALSKRGGANKTKNWNFVLGFFHFRNSNSYILSLRVVFWTEIRMGTKNKFPVKLRRNLLKGSFAASDERWTFSLQLFTTPFDIVKEWLLHCCGIEISGTRSGACSGESWKRSRGGGGAGGGGVEEVEEEEEEGDLNLFKLHLISEEKLVLCANSRLRCQVAQESKKMHTFFEFCFCYCEDNVVHTTWCVRLRSRCGLLHCISVFRHFAVLRKTLARMCTNIRVSETSNLGTFCIWTACARISQGFAYVEWFMCCQLVWRDFVFAESVLYVAALQSGVLAALRQIPTSIIGGGGV